MAIGDRIKARRLEIGLTVDQLAERIGKNRATVYRYESNDIEHIPLDILTPLADALDTTPVYLLGWSKAAQTAHTTLGTVIAQFRAEHKISMDEFAELSGISKAYISMLERNRTPRGDTPSPSYEMYRSVAKAVGMNVDELVRIIEGELPAIETESPLTNESTVILQLKKLREQKGLCMKEAADLMDLPYTTYVNYEKGLREPPLRVLRQLSDFYGVSIDDLFAKEPVSRTMFGIRLKELRQKAGLSQAEVASRIGISKSSVNMYERGEREPNLGMLGAIADFFGVSTDYIIGRSDNSHEVIIASSLSEEHLSFIKALSAASPEELRAFAKFAQLLTDERNKSSTN